LKTPTDIAKSRKTKQARPGTNIIFLAKVLSKSTLFT